VARLPTGGDGDLAICLLLVCPSSPSLILFHRVMFCVSLGLAIALMADVGWKTRLFHRDLTEVVLSHHTRGPCCGAKGLAATLDVAAMLDVATMLDVAAMLDMTAMLDVATMLPSPPLGLMRHCGVTQRDVTNPAPPPCHCLGLGGLNPEPSVGTAACCPATAPAKPFFSAPLFARRTSFLLILTTYIQSDCNSKEKKKKKRIATFSRRLFCLMTLNLLTKTPAAPGWDLIIFRLWRHQVERSLKPFLFHSKTVSK